MILAAIKAHKARVEERSRGLAALKHLSQVPGSRPLIMAVNFLMASCFVAGIVAGMVAVLVASQVFTP